MAAAGTQSFEEEFLTCAICTDIYNNPCTLNCGHSFCRKCVTDYIKTRPQAVQSKTIPCAFCRQVTPVQKPTSPVEKWAGQIKPSLILVGLIDRHQKGRKHGKGENDCFLCKEVGETTPASSWCCDCEVTLCTRCTKMHLKAPYSKKHDVSDLSQPSIKHKRKVKCLEHGEEQVKFICKDCNKAACQTCCIIKHRQCKQIVTIQSMIPDIKSVLVEKRHTLEKTMKENMASVRNEKSKIEALQNAKTKTESEIKSTIKSSITLLRKKQKELLEKLDDITDKQIAEYQANVKSGQITTQMFQQHCEFIDQALQSESEMDMYDMYQICQSGAVGSVGDTESDTRNVPVVLDMRFTPNMEQLKKAVTEMGEVTVVTMEIEASETETKYVPKTLSTPVLHDTIDISHRQDVANPSPVDVTVLTVNDVNIVVVADGNSLKSVYDKEHKREVSRLQMSDSTYCVVKMAGNRVAAIVGHFRIVIAKVRPELSLISNLKTNKNYTGLTSLPDSTLAAGSNSPPVVDILDESGHFLRSFTPHNIGLNLLQYPFYLCTNQWGHILVIDKKSRSVYCLTSKGGVVFAYTPTGDRALREPRGITVMDTGGILLADSISKKIVQLTADGAFVRDILTSTSGIGEPCGLCVDNTNKLYMCERAAGSECIKVFRFT